MNLILGIHVGPPSCLCLKIVKFAVLVKPVIETQLSIPNLYRFHTNCSSISCTTFHIVKLFILSDNRSMNISNFLKHHIFPLQVSLQSLYFSNTNYAIYTQAQATAKQPKAPMLTKASFYWSEIQLALNILLP